MVSLFRRLVWEGTVPLSIRLASTSLPTSSDRVLDSYYIQAPRISYLPLLLPEIRQNLCELVLDENAIASLREEDWWFEAEGGGVMKWHWPIGLLYDTYMISGGSSGSSSSSYFPPSTSSTSAPMQLILHLSNAQTEKLLLTPSLEVIKSSFMAQSKEADFVRWGSTKRMTALRKAEQDGLWEGVREHNFENYWKVASKLCPHPSPPSPSIPSIPSTPNPDGAAALPANDAYSVRSVPLRLFIPDAPVMQDIYPPLLENGIHSTLGDLLSAHLPMLFPQSAAGQQQGAPGAYVLIHGVEPPLESELAWLGACMAGPDGWVNVCVGVRG